VPPTYATQVETICVKPACTKQVFVPAKYGTRPKLVCCEEPQLREKVMPAVWGVKCQERMVCPPQEQWKKIDCPPGDLGPCEIQCECWTKEVKPPVYECEPCPVCLAPERRCITYTPARYKVVDDRFEAVPAHCETVCVPPVFKQCFKEVCATPGHWEWRRNVDCEVPQPEPLTALQVEMEDKAPSGEAAGVFAVGDVVRYDLRVSSDEGSKALENLSVVFTLPPELEFVSGGGAVDIAGEGQRAETVPFALPIGATVAMHVLCKVVSVPPTNMVELAASVRDADGSELSIETENTTIKN